MRLPLLVGLALLAACSDSSDPDEPVDIEGSWTWSAEVTNAEVEITCSATGGATIEQTDDQFSGQIVNSDGTCSSPDGDFPFDFDGAITGGVIEGNSVSYEDNFCEFTGVASGDPTDEVDGDVTCTFIVGEDAVEFTGTWEMTR